MESLETRERRLALAERQLAQDREMLEQAKRQASRQGWRDNLYGRINVSVKTMDRVIIGIGMALVAALVAGVLL